jgi:glycosyltransferase involved in cell wall biosynthesis
MHVLQITPKYFPNIGGVEVIVQRISEELAGRGIKATVYSVDLSDGLSRLQSVNGVAVRRFVPLFSDPLYLPEPNFLRSLRREDADIIHVHNVHTLAPFLVALFKQKGQKLLLQPHYHRFGQSPLRHCLLNLYRRITGNLLVSRTNAIIVNSVYEEKIFCEDYTGRKNVILIPEGVDVNELKQFTRNPLDPKRILYVGALRGYKNVDKILEGFALLIRKGYKFRLAIVGGGPDRAFLIDRSHELGVSPFVEWKRDLSRQQLLREYADASVLALLSPLESFSRVVYEALLMGVPAVVLDYGAMAHLVEDGFAEGVNSLAPEDIADALLRAMSKTYAEISAGPFTFLNWEEYVNRVINVYHKVYESSDA